MNQRDKRKLKRPNRSVQVDIVTNYIMAKAQKNNKRKNPSKKQKKEKPDSSGYYPYPYPDTLLVFRS